MAYKILHLPTATYMYYSLDNYGRTSTKNFYSQYEIDCGYFYFTDEAPAINVFKTRTMAKQFLDRWNRLKYSGCDVDELQFDDDKSYIFQRCHFSIIKVKDEI